MTTVREELCKQIGLHCMPLLSRTTDPPAQADSKHTVPPTHAPADAATAAAPRHCPQSTFKALQHR